MRRRQAGAWAAAVLAIAFCAAAFTRLPVPATAVLGVAVFGALGYVWSGVLLPPRVSGLERAAVGAGLVLAVPVIGGVVLYTFGIPLHRTTWAGLFSAITLAGAGMLVIRRRNAGWAAPPVIPPRRRRVTAGQVVAAGAALALAVAAVALARTGALRQHYPGFTQLWLTSQDAVAGTASLGITNHEGSTTSYRLVLLRKGKVSATWNVTLADGKTWRRAVLSAGPQPVTADLYRLPDLAHPYRYVTTAGGPG